jgi:hypothetical protein
MKPAIRRGRRFPALLYLCSILNPILFRHSSRLLTNFSPSAYLPINLNVASAAGFLLSAKYGPTDFF